jgi:prevent-host-death family protein
MLSQAASLTWRQKFVTVIPLQEAQAKLAELIHRLGPDDEVIVTENNEPIARILPANVARDQRVLGTMRGSVVHMSADFDAPLDEFEEYTR